MARIASLLFACALAGSAPAPAQDGPAGQFRPSPGDRDGDGLVDGRDCAPDDPSRPARHVPDPDCDGSGAGIQVDVAGPVDGGPDPEGPEAASRPSRGTPKARAAARRAAGGPVVAIHGLRLGPNVAVYAPRSGRGIVVVAKSNAGVTVKPRRHRARTRSLASGTAFAVRARAARYVITVVDGSGTTWRAVHRPV